MSSSIWLQYRLAAISLERRQTSLVTSEVTRGFPAMKEKGNIYKVDKTENKNSISLNSLKISPKLQIVTQTKSSKQAM